MPPSTKRTPKNDITNVVRISKKKQSGPQHFSMKWDATMEAALQVIMDEECFQEKTEAVRNSILKRARAIQRREEERRKILEG